MRGPRNATPHEAGKYRIAVKRRNRAALHELVRDTPEVLWGAISSELTIEDLRWARENMPTSDEMEDRYFGA